MTHDYNNGDWHGWNGGDCPVHPESFVRVQFAGDTRINAEVDDATVATAAGWLWHHDGVKGDIVAFRVITPYAEPRVIETWAVLQDGKVYTTFENEYLARNFATQLKTATVVKMTGVLS